MPTFECPTCGKLFTTERNEDAPYRPFCSQRCRLIDLGRWLDGEYCISDPLVPPAPQETEIDLGPRDQRHDNNEAPD